MKINYMTQTQRLQEKMQIKKSNSICSLPTTSNKLFCISEEGDDFIVEARLIGGELSISSVTVNGFLIKVSTVELEDKLIDMATRCGVDIHNELITGYGQ
jgi:hypothetical protein